ncbi:MAG: O-antigen ligase family protein [Candidatus Eisenbacteria bacterium]
MSAASAGSSSKRAWNERATNLGLLLFAFALPLSIAATEISLGLTLLAWISTRPWARPQAPGVRALGLVTLALVGTWLLASATSPLPLASLVNARKIYSIVIVFLLADRARDAGLAGRFVTVTLAAGVLTSVLGFVQFGYRHLNGGFDEPLQGIFSTAMTSGNVLTTLAVAALAFVLFARPSARNPWFDRAALATFFVALALTFRRGSYLGWAAGSLALVGLKRARWLVVVPLVAALALALGPHEARRRALTIAHPVDDTSTGRISLWKSGLAAFHDRPVSGWGLQDGWTLIERYRRPDATFHAGHFHNDWVQIAVSTGALGLVAYGAWMVLAGWLAWQAFRRTRSPLAAAGLAAWISFQVYGLFDWSFGDAEVANQLFVWVGLALAAGAALTPRGASATLTSEAVPPAHSS